MVLPFWVFNQNDIDQKSIYFDESESDSARLSALKNWIWQDYMFKDIDSAKILIELGKDYAKATNNLIKHVELTSFSGIASSISGNQLKSIEYFEEALSLLEGKEKVYENMTATLYNNLGNVFAELGNTEQSIKMYTESLKIMIALENPVGMGNAYNNIGNLHRGNGAVDIAQNYFKKAYRSFEKVDNYIGLGNVANNLMNFKLNENDLDSAMFYAELALDHYSQVKNDIGVSKVLSKKARIFSKQNDFNQAIETQNESINLISKFGDKSELATGLLGLSDIYFDKKDYDKAQEFIDEAYKLASGEGSFDVRKEIRLSRYLLYKAKGKNDLALEDLEAYLTYKDSLEVLEVEEMLMKKRYEYEYAKKTIQDSLAKVEHNNYIAEKIRRKELEIQQGQQRNIFLILIVVLVLISAFWIFRRLKISQKQTKIIAAQKEQVEDQRNVLDIKNKEIMDSINYAKRLQDAILPSKVYFQTHFEDHFIFYKPKDVVSGDFYWLERIGNELYLAAADCTGHGVPGAMVSVVCSNALTKSVLEEKRTNPSDILGRAREIIVEHFGRGGTGIYDGMDIALIKVVFSDEEQKNAQKIVFAGAHNPFWMIRNDEFIEIKGDSQPVGNYAEIKPFHQHDVAVEKGDMVYLFSDGYLDQFGGPNVDTGGKKYKKGKFRKLILELKDLSMPAQKDKLAKEIEEWKGELPQTDDIVIIGLKF